MMYAKSPVNVLPSVYDAGAYSEEAFQAELDRAHNATAIEREWMADAGLKTYASDADILLAADADKFVRVSKGLGYSAIPKLLAWSPARSDPNHPFHYSPPYLEPHTFRVMERLAHDWDAEMAVDFVLSFTSFIRSDLYQERLGQQERKLTINRDGLQSSHQTGIAFDIDAVSLYEHDDGVYISYKPETPGYDPELVKASRFVLSCLLDEQAKAGVLNYVEEVPGTRQHVFHVAVKPIELT